MTEVNTSRASNKEVVKVAGLVLLERLVATRSYHGCLRGQDHLGGQVRGQTWHIRRISEGAINFVFPVYIVYSRQIFLVD